jgi:hypothetical protein
MRFSVRILILCFLLIPAVTSCRPACTTVTTTHTPTPLILSPLYQADSYRDLIEKNWIAYPDQPVSVTFEEFEKIVGSNKLESEDLEDVFATLFAIASQHAFVQGTPLSSDYFLAAADLSCWWHPPITPPPNAGWLSIRPDVILRASDSGLTRLNLADRVDPSIYAMSPNDVIELLKTKEVESFFQINP